MQPRLPPRPSQRVLALAESHLKDITDVWTEHEQQLPHETRRRKNIISINLLFQFAIFKAGGQRAYDMYLPEFPLKNISNDKKVGLIRAFHDLMRNHEQWTILPCPFYPLPVVVLPSVSVITIPFYKVNE